MRLNGRFLVFAQSRYAEGFGNGLSSEGVIYIPETCAAKGGCRLHIALHGCEQNRDQVGMAFIEGSGFAGWADTNNLVILFPQVEAGVLNPKACWVLEAFSFQWQSRGADGVSEPCHFTESKRLH